MLGLAIRTGNLIDKEIYRTRKILNWISKLRIICTVLYRRRAVRLLLKSRVENRKKIFYMNIGTGNRIAPKT
jgi:trehalose-6-phosphate synthase